MANVLPQCMTVWLRFQEERWWQEFGCLPDFLETSRNVSLFR